MSDEGAGKMDLTDKSSGVRTGEELDADRVAAFLSNTVRGLSGKVIVAQFPSGYSNLTYLVTMGDRELVLRRPPFGRKAKTAHDMGREYRILKALNPVFPYGPKPLVYCEDESVLGCPFYVMERIKGIIVRRDLPDGLTLSPLQMRSLCENLLDVHLQLHSIDYQSIGLDGLGKPAGYVRRQVEGWSERYKAARTEDAPSFEAVMAWLQAEMQPDFPRPAIIHNDYKMDNVVLDPANPLKIIGVLDWEMATIGDPLMDLGNSLAYWVQADDPEERQLIRTGPTNLPGALTRTEMVQRYKEKAGIDIEDFSFYLCFGVFRLAVIAQQIYYRYFHGQTNDPRFQRLVGSVHNLEQAALGIMRGVAL
jgi:aminoglycoside phosphotransferase (APT) family kinase protein